MTTATMYLRHLLLLLFLFADAWDGEMVDSRKMVDARLEVDAGMSADGWDDSSMDDRWWEILIGI